MGYRLQTKKPRRKSIMVDDEIYDHILIQKEVEGMSINGWLRQQLGFDEAKDKRKIRKKYHSVYAMKVGQVIVLPWRQPLESCQAHVSRAVDRAAAATGFGFHVMGTYQGLRVERFR